MPAVHTSGGLLLSNLEAAAAPRTPPTADHPCGLHSVHTHLHAHPHTHVHTCTCICMQIANCKFIYTLKSYVGKSEVLRPVLKMATLAPPPQFAFLIQYEYKHPKNIPKFQRFGGEVQFCHYKALMPGLKMVTLAPPPCTSGS